MSNKLRSIGSVFGIGAGIFTGHAIFTGNERFYREMLMPTLHLLVPDGERAHWLAVKAMRYGIGPKRSQSDCTQLQRDVFGLQFSHPIGIAAGFDKHGEAVMGLLNAGFSHVEVGTVTPEPQEGNPRPRVFRWREREAVVNRYGFNSVGHDVVYNRLKDRPWEGKGIVGVNLGCNKSSIDPAADFVAGVKRFGDIADYLVINVSSPNTPGLRSMQQKHQLHDLLSRVLAARSQLRKKTPILLKISPDESDQSLTDIVEIALEPKTRIDGLIVSNTTLCNLEDATACGAVPKKTETSIQNFGGLSGKPVFDKSTVCLNKVARLTQGRIPLIGVGGISNATDVQAKLKAGATLVQLYTSMIYQGPVVAQNIVRDLAAMGEQTELKHPSIV